METTARFVAAALLASLLCACGGGGSSGQDADSDTAIDGDTTDLATDSDAPYDPVPDWAGDTDADVVADGDDDPDGADGPSDPDVDVVEGEADAPLDTPGEDAPDDSAADASDPGTDPTGCGPLDVEFRNVEVWTQCWMGIGTSAAFTLRFTNPKTDCDVEGVSVASGTLRLDSDDSIVLTFGSLTPLTVFSGTVPALSYRDVDWSASDTSLDSSALDGIDVYVRANVVWTGGSTSLRSLATSLTCVY